MKAVYIAVRSDEPGTERWRERADALARDAFNMRSPTGGVARLVHDSLVDADGTAEDHDLRFEHEDLTVFVHVSAANGHTELVGHFDPPNSTTAVLQSPGDHSTQSTAAATGEFVFPTVEHGLVRLLINAPRGTTIYSEWFRV